MSGDAVPQPPAPTDDEREAAACAWADHRSEYGASTDPVLLARDHGMFLAGYHDGRREQRHADKLASSDKHQGTEPVNIDASGRLAAMDARKRYTAHHAGSRDPLSGEATVIWEAGYRFAVDDETHPHPLGMLGRWLDYWGSSPVDGDQRLTFALGYQWREHERQTTTEQESTTMTETTPQPPLQPGEVRELDDGRRIIGALDGTQRVLADAPTETVAPTVTPLGWHTASIDGPEPETWTPHPLPEGHDPETPAEYVHRAIGEALGAASTAWENPAGAGEFDSTKAKTICDGLSAVVDDHARQWAADHPTYPGRRVVVIDLESGRWLRPSDPITGAEGARAASSLLPGTTEADLAAFYDAHMTDPEPAEALVGELAYLPGHEPLPVVAARLAVELVSAPGRLGGGTAENATKTADTLLAWLRKEVGEPGWDLPAMELGEAEPERPSTGEALLAALDEQEGEAASYMNTLRGLPLLSTVEASELIAVIHDRTRPVPRAHQDVDAIAKRLRADLAGWTLSPSEADGLHEAISRRTVHGAPSSGMVRHHIIGALRNAIDRDERSTPLTRAEADAAHDLISTATEGATPPNTRD